MAGFDAVGERDAGDHWYREELSAKPSPARLKAS
jgi:hypothetical protein